MARSHLPGVGPNSEFFKGLASSTNPGGVTPGGLPGFTGDMYQNAVNSGYVNTDPNNILGPGRLGQGLSTDPSSTAYSYQEAIGGWNIADPRTAADAEEKADLLAELEARAEVLASMGLAPNDIAARWYSPKSQDAYQGVEEARKGAGLTDLPTSTTNFRRPRTVAAGWKENDDDYLTGTLTVVFRDGTPYNFYDVPRSVWIKFHTSISKGRPYLNTTFPRDYAHGPADVSSLDPSMLEAVYMAVRTTQLYYSSSKGHYQTYYKTVKTPRATDKVVRYDKEGNAVVKRRIKTEGSPQNPTAKSAKPRQASGGKNPSASAGKNPNQK